jgi:tetraacyldisaccharide 4'-kinase
MVLILITFSDIYDFLKKNKISSEVKNHKEAFNKLNKLFEKKTNSAKSKKKIKLYWKKDSTKNIQRDWPTLIHAIKKPKFWDKKKPNLISNLLLPFTSIIKLNNLFQSFALPKKSNLIKSICVGNIYVGGTGKTPTTIKLFKILEKLKIKVAVGKKFYPSQKDEITILKNHTNLIISNNRKNIIKKAKELKQEMVVFDDGLQDNSVYHDIKIVCFDYQNWIGNGQLIPAGPLREKLDSLKKYDCVFLKDTDSNKLILLQKKLKR